MEPRSTRRTFTRFPLVLSLSLLLGIVAVGPAWADDSTAVTNDRGPAPAADAPSGGPSVDLHEGPRPAGSGETDTPTGSDLTGAEAEPLADAEQPVVTTAMVDAWIEGIAAALAEASAEASYDPWAPVRQCESGGNYATNTGNGFYGAYQFTVGTWNWVAGMVLPSYVGVRPDVAPAWAQDRVAQGLGFEVAGGGLHHWPVCGRLYGT